MHTIHTPCPRTAPLHGEHRLQAHKHGAERLSKESWEMSSKAQLQERSGKVTPVPGNRDPWGRGWVCVSVCTCMQTPTIADRPN